jgi:dTDP-4-dehydrorhamnose 3,5-epimerase
MNFEIIQPNTDKVNPSEPFLLKTRIFEDSRGYFLEIFQKKALAELGFKEEFVQDNIAYSTQNVLRGMHFQMKPKSQGKFVICLQGEIVDVVVDVRKNSPTFGEWQKFSLSAENGHLVYIPVGFAHGYVVKSPESLVMYKTTNDYAPEVDSGFIWSDPDVGIDWGIEDPIVSDKDNMLTPLADAKNNFEYGMI